MKVSIKHTELKHGLVMKKTYPAVELHVEFSEEEKQVIREHKLGEHNIIGRGMPVTARKELYELSKKEGFTPTVFSLSIKDLLKGADVFPFENLQYANEYVEYVKQRLPVLKNMLAAKTDLAASEDVSFEL